MSEPFVLADDCFRFTWDVARDRAELRRHPYSPAREGGDSPALIWTGSLLPLFWLQHDGRLEAVQATAVPGSITASTTGLTLQLRLGELGRGVLTVAANSGLRALRFERLDVTWESAEIPRIVALHFGCGILDATQRAAAPSLDVPFWPDWRAEGFCVASAKTSPMQSFFRSWDFGHARIPLGSFGPAMGTPYAAAFPRPLYAGAMGGHHGWLALGAGVVPDAALTLAIRARSGSLEWLYREDLWPAAVARDRSWTQPLWLAWAPQAWEAYRDYFRLFGPTELKASHQKSFAGTWGDFRTGRFDLPASAERAAGTFGADVFCLDDPWESAKGSGRPHPGRLPRFAADLEAARQLGLGIGLWMPTAWIEDVRENGLGPDDLLLGRDGRPVTANWACDPREEGAVFFCLDPSSERARTFLRERTQRLMREVRPTLLKIDFGYGVPGPDACMPRDPAFRGERLAWSLAKIIRDAAREVDAAVTVLAYSLHPLWAAVQDQCSLDDLGDAGAHEAEGHGHWSIWAALAGERGMALLSSSGYRWSADSDVLLNTAVLGAPGTNLPRCLDDGSVVPPAMLARRRALFRWHRPCALWEPAWFDSSVGSLEAEPAPHTWGRWEKIAGQPTLTALALRETSPVTMTDPVLRGLRWSGRWALIAQDDRSVFASDELALVPFSAGWIELPLAQRPGRVVAMLDGVAAAFEGWTWQEGRLTLAIDATLGDRALEGFLIKT